MNNSARSATISRVADTLTTTGWRADLGRAVAAMGAVGGLTAVYFSWLRVTNPTTIALSFLLVILFVAASSRLWAAASRPNHASAG